MEYKVLIKLFVPEIEEIYEMYIPINKTVGDIAKCMDQLVNNISGIYPLQESIKLFNRHTGVLYSPNILIRDTDIRNGTELVMFSTQAKVEETSH